MSRSIERAPRRMLTWLAAGALALTGLAITGSPARAAESMRIAGENRYETSVAVSGEFFDATTSDVIIARGDPRDDGGQSFADALAASGLAGRVSAPILLTDDADIPDVILGEIARLDPDTVHIAGGEAAVSAAVEAEIDAATDATINRFPGENRFDTAALMADAIGADNVGQLNGLATAIVATGWEFPDALAGGPIAYAGAHPILLVGQDDVPEETAQALTRLNIQQVVILGETDAVSADVEAELESAVGNEAIRLGGANRFETAVDIADAAVAQFGFDTDDVLLSRSHVPADALSGGPLGGATTTPILLTPTDSLNAATEGWLTTNFPAIVRVLGGPAAVSDATVAAAVEAATTETQTFDNVTLSWINEVDTTGAEVAYRQGEPEAQGSASLTLDLDADTVQFSVDYSEVTGPYADAPGFHIHQGGIDENGPIVLYLATGPELDAETDEMLEGVITDDEATATGTGEDEVDLDALINDIVANPDNYYLNLHSNAFPLGAIRGQLPDGGQDLIPEPVDGGLTDAPDLVAVQNFDDAADTVEVVFDEGVSDVLIPTGFALIGADGTTVLRSASATVSGTSGDTVIAQFDPGAITADTQSSTARAYAQSGAVTDGAAANPQQTVDVSNNGATAGPDLVSIIVDIQEETVFYQFDEAVAFVVGGGPGDFQVYDAGAVETQATAVAVSTTDPAVVVADFDADPATGGEVDGVVGASVDGNTVQGTDGTTNLENQADSVVIQP